MGEELNGYVDFVGDFERPEHYYETSGKEIAQLLAEELPRLGINILSVQPFGDCYRIRCVCSRSHFELAVSITHHDETGKRWSILADAERSLFGEPKFCELDLRVLLLAVHEVLLRSERVTDIKWYPQFDTPEYLKLITASSSPIRTKLDQHQQHALIGIEERGTRLINRIVSPAGAVATLALVVVMMIAIPMHVAQITGLLFIAFIVAMVLWPLVMSLLVASEARKKNDTLD